MLVHSSLKKLCSCLRAARVHCQQSFSFLPAWLPHLLTILCLSMQIMMAHTMWTKLGSSKYDYNFTFATPSTADMYKLMPAEERAVLKVHFLATKIPWEQSCRLIRLASWSQWPSWGGKTFTGKPLVHAASHMDFIECRPSITQRCSSVWHAVWM